MGKTDSRTKTWNPTGTQLLQIKRNASAPKKLAEQPVLHVPPWNARSNDEEEKKC